MGATVGNVFFGNESDHGREGQAIAESRARLNPYPAIPSQGIAEPLTALGRAASFIDRAGQRRRNLLVGSSRI